MPISRITRRADRGARAIRCLTAVEAEIVALADDDLLDLADIFFDAPNSPLGRIATAEMARRGINLD